MHLNISEAQGLEQKSSNSGFSSFTEVKDETCGRPQTLALMET